MNINAIPQELIKLHTAQNEKMGKLCSTPDFKIEAIDQNAFIVVLWDCPEVDFQSGINRIKGDTPDEVFAEAWVYINGLPSLAEQQLAEFQGDLANLIDKGRDFNIALDIVNPLIATSKKLAENAITKQECEE
jgi:hypothetical protein